VVRHTLSRELATRARRSPEGGTWLSCCSDCGRRHQQAQLTTRLRHEHSVSVRVVDNNDAMISDHEVDSVVVLPLPPRYRLKDLLLGEQHSEDDRFVLLTIFRCVCSE